MVLRGRPLAWDVGASALGPIKRLTHMRHLSRFAPRLICFGVDPFIEA
jgi:hypothetical protein